MLWLVTFVDSFVHNCYFNWTGTFPRQRRAAGGVGIPGNWIMPVMSIGQIAEILTMFILGATLKRLGWRTTMIIGILGHAARFAVFAFFPDQPWLIILIKVLHGICYAFFFATVYIFVDEFFPKDARASAQGLFNLMILGVGPLVANSSARSSSAKPSRPRRRGLQEPVPGAVRRGRRRRVCCSSSTRRRRTRSRPAAGTERRDVNLQLHVSQASKRQELRRSPWEEVALEFLSCRC